MPPLHNEGVRAVVYVRVSTEEQSHGLSLESQREACLRKASELGWSVESIVTEHTSAKSMKRRPQLAMALGRLDSGEFDALMVSRLDRLSRSVVDFAMTLERASARGWQVICLDPAVDTTTPYGEAMANMAAVFAQLERRLIGQRQRESVAARKAAGIYRGGAKRSVPDHVCERMAELRAEGLSLRKVGARLELEGLRPPRAAHWHSQVIRELLARSSTNCGVRGSESPQERHDDQDDQNHQQDVEKP